MNLFGKKKVEEAAEEVIELSSVDGVRTYISGRFDRPEMTYCGYNVDNVATMINILKHYDITPEKLNMMCKVYGINDKFYDVIKTDCKLAEVLVEEA